MHTNSLQLHNAFRCMMSGLLLQAAGRQSVNVRIMPRQRSKECAFLLTGWAARLFRRHLVFSSSNASSTCCSFTGILIFTQISERPIFEGFRGPCCISICEHNFVSRLFKCTRLSVLSICITLPLAHQCAAVAGLSAPNLKKHNQTLKDAKDLNNVSLSLYWITFVCWLSSQCSCE